MIYMFKVFLVVAVPVFGLAGAVLLAFAAWSAAKDYARVHLGMRHAPGAESTEPLRISSLSSKSRSAESFRAA
jgi:hypothetical protein